MDRDKENNVIGTVKRRDQADRVFGKDLIRNKFSPQIDRESFDLFSKFLKNSSRRHLFSLRPLATQSEINWKMRQILLVWLNEIYNSFNLQTETFFLTVHIIDNYLSLFDCPIEKFQLVGITSIWIASKFEEVYCIQIKELLHLSCSIYTDKDVYDMEIDILKGLKYRICITSSFRIAMFMCIERGTCVSEMHLVQFLLELALFECQIAKFEYFLVAKVAVFMMYKLVKKEVEEKLSDEEKACAKMILILLQNRENKEIEVVKQKFASGKYGITADLW